MASLYYIPINAFSVWFWPISLWLVPVLIQRPHSCNYCGLSSGACYLSLPGSSLRQRCGENDSQREAATQEPPSCAGRQDTGHAEVAAALRRPKHTSGKALSHVTVMMMIQPIICVTLWLCSKWVTMYLTLPNCIICYDDDTKDFLFLLLCLPVLSLAACGSVDIRDPRAGRDP